MKGVVLPKENSLPEMEEENEQEKKPDESTTDVSIQDVLINLEQRIINLEACILRIRGAI